MYSVFYFESKEKTHQRSESQNFDIFCFYCHKHSKRKGELKHTMLVFKLKLMKKEKQWCHYYLPMTKIDKTRLRYIVEKDRFLEFSQI